MWWNTRLSHFRGSHVFGDYIERSYEEKSISLIIVVMWWNTRLSHFRGSHVFGDYIERSYEEKSISRYFVVMWWNTRLSHFEGRRVGRSPLNSHPEITPEHVWSDSVPKLGKTKLQSQDFGSLIFRSLICEADLKMCKHVSFILHLNHRWFCCIFCEFLRLMMLSGSADWCLVPFWRSLASCPLALAPIWHFWLP